MRFRGVLLTFGAAIFGLVPSFTLGAVQRDSSGSGTEADPWVVMEWELTLLAPGDPFFPAIYEGWAVVHSYWSKYEFTITGTTPNDHWHNENGRYDLYENYDWGMMEFGIDDWVFDDGWGMSDMNEWTIDFQPRYITGEAVEKQRTSKSIQKSLSPDGTSITEHLMIHSESGYKKNSILEQIEDWEWTIDEAGLKTGTRNQYDYQTFCITVTDYFVEAVSFSPFVGIQHQNTWTWSLFADDPLP